MDKRTKGTVISVKKQWWMKINTKTVRMHALDGAIFPHVITVEYTIDGRKYKKRKWISAGAFVPPLNSEMTVQYDENKPGKSKVLWY